MADQTTGVGFDIEGLPQFIQQMKTANAAFLDTGVSAKAMSVGFKDVSNASNQMQSGVVSLDRATRDLKSAQLDTAKASVALKEAQQSLTKAGKEDEAAQKGVADATQKLKAAQLETARATVTLKEAQLSASDSSSKLAKGLNETDQAAKHAGATIKVDATTAVLGLGAAAGAATVAFGVDSVKAFVAFEGKLNTIRAVSDATASDIKKMSATALQLGQDFPVSANDAAQGMVELSKAGFSANEVLEASHGLVLLASAAQIDMGESAEIVAGSIRGFGLAASDTNKVVDILAKAANASSVDVSDLGETFKYVAPAARAVGFSIEDVASASAIMGNNMIKGSEAGTALRSTIIGLTGASSSSKKELEKLGVSTADSSGKMRDFHSILVDLRGSFSKLSDQQSILAAKNLVGTEAMSGFLTLIKTSDADFNAMFEGINNATGAAGRMAKVMQEGLSGALTNLSGSIDTLQIKFGRGLAPGIQQITESLNDLTNSSSDTAEALGKKIGDSLANLAPVIEVTVKLLPLLVDGLNAVVAPMELFAGGMGFLADRFEDLTGKVRPVPETLAGVGTAAEDITAKISTMSSATDAAKDSTGNYAETAESASSKLKMLTTEIDNLTKSANENKKEMNEASGQIKVLDEIVSPMPKHIQELWKEFKSYSDTAAEGGANSADAAQKADALKAQLIQLNPALADVTKAYGISSEHLHSATDAYHENTLAAILNEGKQGDVKNSVYKTIAAHKDLGITLTDLAGVAGKVGNELGTNLGKGVADGVNAMTASVAAAAAGMVRAAKEAAQKEGAIKSPSLMMAKEVGKPIAQGTAKGIRDGTPEISQAAGDMMIAAGQASLKELDGQMAILQKRIKNTELFQGPGNGALRLAQQGQREANGTWDISNNLEETRKQLDTILQKKRDIENGIGELYTRNADAATQAFGSSNASMSGGLGGGRGVQEAGRQIGQQLMDGFISGVGGNLQQLMGNRGVGTGDNNPLVPGSQIRNNTQNNQQTTIHNSPNYNLSVNTRQSAGRVTSDFTMMRVQAA